MKSNTSSPQFIVFGICLISLLPGTSAVASIQLAVFDVTHAISSSSAPIPTISTAVGVTSSPLIPIGVSSNGTSTPGLYWDASWTTSSTPNSLSQRLFFNVFAGVGTSVDFDSLDFDVFSGGSSPMGIELRVFGSGGSTILSPQLLVSGLVSSPVNSAAHIAVDVSSLAPLHDGDAYQFSLSFFNRNPSFRIGLSGDRSDIGVSGGNVILTGASMRRSRSTLAARLDRPRGGNSDQLRHPAATRRRNRKRP